MRSRSVGPYRRRSPWCSSPGTPTPPRTATPATWSRRGRRPRRSWRTSRKWRPAAAAARAGGFPSRAAPPYPQTRRYVIRVLRRYDPAAAHAAAARIYGPRPTVVVPVVATQVVSLDWPPPPARPIALGPWRERATVRWDSDPVRDTNSP